MEFGGAVTLFSGWKPLKDAIGTNLKFASRLAFYPPCFAVPDNMDFENIPTHVLIGDFDTWTPAQACIEFEEIMQSLDYDFMLQFTTALIILLIGLWA